MISLYYRCDCGVALSSLDDAQQHADSADHVVNVLGTVTSRRAKPLTKPELDAQEDRAVLRKLERQIERMKAEIAS